MAKNRRTVRSRTSSRSESRSSVSPMVIGGVVVASILLVGVLVWLGNLQTSNASATVDFDEFPALGDADAPVTIVEYSDYGCPHCRDYVINTSEQVIEEYVQSGQVRYIVHSFNLGRPETALAAEAGWCVADQGASQFFDYQRHVFDNFGTPYNQSNLMALAEDIEGIDASAFSSCLSGRTHQNDVEVARRAAANRGVRSTPTFFINDQKIEGNQPFEVLQGVIEQELALAQ